MKIVYISVMTLVLSLSSYAQNSQIDTVAIMMLNKMGTLIGELESCSFTLNTSNDVIDVDLGLVKFFNTHQVYMVGPDKMMVNSQGDKGRRGYWYNGKHLIYYSYTENNFAMIDAPSNIIATIDTVNETYGIEFPAADFFYPTFTRDLIAQSNQIIFVGKSKVADKDCFHIIATNAGMSIQIWISDVALFLPLKYVIVYYDVDPNQQYEATFSDWRLNPDLPNEMFEFTPPPLADQIKLIAK
jgi:hypothetical protein